MHYCSSPRQNALQKALNFLPSGELIIQRCCSYSVAVLRTRCQVSYLSRCRNGPRSSAAGHPHRLFLARGLGFVRISHSCHCQILSVDGACLSLAPVVVPTPVKTILELSRPAFEVLPKTGDVEPVDWGKPGWERLSTVCARSISAWQQQVNVLWMDRQGVNSWRQLRLHDVLRRDRERWRWFLNVQWISSNQVTVEVRRE